MAIKSNFVNTLEVILCMIIGQLLVLGMFMYIGASPNFLDWDWQIRMLEVLLGFSVGSAIQLLSIGDFHE